MGQMTRSFPVFRLIGILAVISLPLLMSSCGSQQTADVAPATGTGSVAFSVKWEPPPASAPPGSGKEAAVRPMAPVVDVCTDYGIASVTMAVFNGPPPPIQEISKNCLENGATLGNIPAGVDNLVLRLTGTPGPWIGDSAFFKLNPSENKDLGIITMGYKGNDVTHPTILLSTPPDNTSNVLNSSVIQITFSEKMAKNTVIDKDSIVVVDNGSNRVPGTTTYNDTNNTATFTPASPLAAVKHTVTVDNMVTDMSGLAISAPATWSFTVHKTGDWFNPTIIDAGLSGSDSLSFASNAAGDAVAVWRETTGGTAYRVYANRYSAGTWGTAGVIQSGTGSSNFPDVDIDESGNAFAVWSQYDGTYDHIHFNQYKGGAWGVADRVDIDDRTENWRPAVAMVKTNGSALVLWGVSDPQGDWRVFYRNFRGDFGAWEGGPYGPADNIDWRFPKITSVGSGLYTATVWVKQYVFDGNVCCKDDLLAFVDMGVTPGEYISIDNDAKLASHAVAVDNNANTIVVWSHKDGRIYAKRYTNSNPGGYPSGTWGAGIPISIAAGDHPAIAMNNNGDAIVVWEQNTSPPYNIYANRYTAGAWGTTPVPIESGSGNATLPQVAMNAKGDAVAVWIQNDGIADSIYANRFSASAGTWGTAVPIESGSGAVSSPLVGIDSNGRAVAVWVQNDGTRNRIYSNRTD